jgi:alpha-tubulin suppressor-like RCC1 family protein
VISSRRRLSVVLAAAAVVLPILAGIAATESEASAQLAAVANCTTPGVVCAWGDNSWGVLGNGSGSDTLVPGPVSTLTDVVKVSATAATSFRAFTFALQADGTVWSWGYGADGQLGTGGFLRGNLPSSSVPQKIPTLANIVDVAAGPFEGFGYAVGRDGSVSSWGAGWDGQLGNNTYGENAWSSAPTPVLGLDDVVAVDASNHNGFALSRNGTVWAWGSGYGGMLGNGTLGDPDTHRALTPVQVSLPPGITAIAAGSQNAYALDSNGAVWAWGTCLNGALGDPTYFCGTDPLTPVRVATPAGVRIVQIAAANTNVGTAYALGEDGIVRAWGFGYQGELGDGSSGIESDGQYHFNATPGPVSNLTDVMSIGAAGGNGYAVLRDGTAWSWGTRRDGVLGDGSTGGNGPGALVPVQIVGLSYPKAITGALTGYAVIGHPQAYGPPCPAGTPRAGEPRRKGDTNCDGKVRIAILGDSYISGEGSADAVDQEPPNEPTWGYGATDTDANNCHRSEASWAYRVASTLAGEPADGIAFIACSGAAMANFFNHAQYPESPSNVVGGGIQLDDLESFDLDGGLDRGSTDLVFLSVGGNDVGFGDIIRECMLGSCVPGANSRYLPRPDGIRAELDHTYAAIAALAPSAEIWVADYMNAITGRECRATGASDLINFLPASLTGSEDHRLTVSRPEQLYFKNTFLPALNGAIHDEVTALGLRQFPTYSQFAGHELCEDQPYVNGFKGGDETFTYKGVTLPQIVGKESWHPNPMGHRRMANSFLSTIVSRTDFGTLPSYHGVIASPAVVPPIPVVSGSGGVNPDSPGKLIQPAAPLTIQGSGAPPATTLRIVIQSMPTVLANPVSDANGDFSVTLPMPAWLPPGFHVLTVDDPATGAVIGTDLIAADAAAGCAPDPNESDVDEDLRPDLCDPDLSDGPAADGDGDGVVNGLDDCVAVADPGQADANDNGVGDACDPELGKDLFTGARPAGLAAGTFVSLAPTRVLDTRHAVGVSTTTAVPACPRWARRR